VIVLPLVVMVGSSRYAPLRKKPGQRQPAACKHCELPVETD